MLHLRPATSSATLNALPRPRGTTLRRACLQPLARSRLDRLLSKSYAVRVLGDSAPTIQSVSDLNEWVPPQGQSAVVQVDGWVRNVRKASTIRFAEIVDGSSVNAMQAVVPKEDATQLRAGSAVRLTGRWYYQPNKPAPNASDADNTVPIRGEDNDSLARSQGQSARDAAAQTADHEGVPITSRGELQVTGVQILGESDPSTYPIQHKYRTPESLRQIPHLRGRYPLNNSILRIRSEAIAVLTQFFAQERFLQTHPPIITSSDCEGAGEAFQVVATSTKGSFFNGPKYLTVSSQLHLEAMAQSMGNVWTLSPTFRAEHSDTSRHLSEFYMLEAEIAFVDDMDQVMSFIQKMLTHLARGLSQCKAWRELDSARQTARHPILTKTFADLENQEVLRRRLSGLLVPERWPRITYTDAVSLLQAESDRFGKSLRWGEGLRSEHEKFLAVKLGYDEARNAYMPVFVTHYPRDIKAFYMLRSDSQSAEGKTVDCFDLIVPGIGELLGGSMREHRLPKLIESLRHFGHSVDRKGRADPGLDWYIDLRRWGSPPHGGFGLGFDRVLSYLTGVPSVRDLVAFPRVYGRADC